MYSNISVCVDVSVRVCSCECVCGKYSTLRKYLGVIILNDLQMCSMCLPSPNTFDLPLYRNVYILQCIMFHTV